MRIKRIVYIIIGWWSKTNYVFFIGFSLLLTYIIPLLLAPILLLFNLQHYTQYYNNKDFITYLIIAPFFETMISQVLPIYLIDKYISKSRIIQILLSSFLFGIMHFQNISVVLLATSGGVVFSTSYLAYKRYHTWEYAYMTIALVHLIRNAITLFIKY